MTGWMRELGGADRTMESDVPTDPEVGSGLELRSRVAGDDGRVVTASDGGRTVGLLHVEGRSVRELRVARDASAGPRAVELLRSVTTEGERVTVEPRATSRPVSPEQVDLRDPDDSFARELWERGGLRDIAELGATRANLPEQTSEPPPLREADEIQPGLYRRVETDIGESVTALESPENWIGAINDGDDADVGRLFNCGDCARAVESRWRGVDAHAASSTDVTGEPTEVMKAWTPGETVPTSFDEIHDRLRALGPGASAIIGFDRAEGGGHWFNAVNDGGRILTVDGQIGRAEPWPPGDSGPGLDVDDAVAVEAVLIDPHGEHLAKDGWEQR